MTVSVNDSPLAGREGDKVQSRVIRDRLLKEAESERRDPRHRTSEKDAYEVAGRGELQLGVLIENMRREGFEVSSAARASVYQTARERREAGAHRGGRHRRRRRAHRRRHREADRPQGRS
jgi:GTP-binding protein